MQIFAELFGYSTANFCLLSSLLASGGYTILAVYPVQAYMRRGWAIKKAEIFGSFSPKAKLLYLETFQSEKFAKGPESEAKSQAEAVKKFEDLYQIRYGRYRYWAPLLLFVIAIFVSMFLLSEAACGWIILSSHSGAISMDRLQQGTPLILIPQVSAAGIGGAYLWIVSDMISRARRLDLQPADILNSALRIAMSAALAVAISQLVTAALALPIAFAIGAFPLDTVRAMLRRIASDKLKLGVGIEEKSTDQVLNLDGVDHPTADRLLDADVSTIAQLAYADPVQLCMRTGLSFDFIIDVGSQALAWMYLGDRLDDLRAAGLRGAMEINFFLEQLNSEKSSQKALAEGLLAIIPTLPKDIAYPPTVRRMETAGFLNACDEIGNDPYTVFLVEIWHDGAQVKHKIVPDYERLLGKTPAPVDP
jgi:hypothetical protein